MLGKIINRDFSIKEEYKDYMINVENLLFDSNGTQVYSAKELLDSNDEYLVGWMIIRYDGK